MPRAPEILQLICPACGELGPHRVQRQEHPELCEVQSATCAACGIGRSGCRVHYAWTETTTACCLPLGQGRYAGSRHLERVECADCVQMLATELLQAPVPDWRPAQAIAEDLYAA